MRELISNPVRVLQRWVRLRTRPKHRLEAPEPLARLPATHIEAARSLIDPDFVRSERYRMRLLQQPFDGLMHEADEFARAFLRELQVRGIPMVLVVGYRSREDQARVFANGFSKARPGRSPHQYGMAVDIAHATRGWDLTKKEWAVIGLIGQEVARKRKIRVTWGGDFKSIYDPAHWELADWKSRAGL